MEDLTLTVYADQSEFTEDWQALGFDSIETEQYWALLEELPSNELLVHLPEWLADEKVGFVDGATPRTFVGRIDRETEKAILITDSAAARPLSQLAHRIQSLEASISRLEAQDDTDPTRIQWLQGRLENKRDAINDRDDLPSLSDGWLPKSQLEFIGRHAPTD